MPVRLACIWLIAYGLTHLSSAMLPIPLPTLDPRDATWALTVHPGLVPIRFYGQVAASLLVATLVTLAAGAVLREPSEDVPTSPLWPLWALTSVALSLGYHAWHNWP
jgi:hypothetical protein